MKGVVAETHEREPYEGLAAIYDYVMRHVDYEGWAAYVRRIFQRFDEGGVERMVDLACGTGNLTIQLHALGYHLAGVDGSAAMLKVARGKAVNQAREIDFRTGDLRALEGVGGPFDAAVCLYDSFNYLLTPVDVDAALLAVCRILDPSSLFIFDVCTERNSLVHFSNVQDAEEGPGFVYTRHSYYDKRRQLQFNSFDICLGKEGDHVRETHSQRIYPHSDLLARIEASPFELLGAYDGFTFNRGSDESDRVHFVLRSPARQSA